MKKEFKPVDLSEKEAQVVIDKIAAAISQWTTLAANHGVIKERIKEIGKVISNL